ncbi:hypothetical protein NA78x_000828 [Anatilimnocola sp. NA78]|uniref:hypothetical protein n=1 Tax=Anatilimnocola sp. NA78 TaxID=3415683 RepID=UPI003CE5A1E1
MKSCEVVETIEDSDDVVIAEIIDEKVIKTEAKIERVGTAMLLGSSAKANEPPGQARGRMGEGRERKEQERSDSKSSPSSCPTTEFLRSTAPAFTTERHPSAVEKFTPKPGSAISVDARGRLVQEAEGFRRLVPTNWIEPPPSKFPVQTVEESF